MKPIKESEIYSCPKCHVCFDVDRGEELPGYCKHCETEFDEPERTRYVLSKLVDGEWWKYGTYDTVESLAQAVFYLGRNEHYVLDVKIEKTDE